MCEKYEKWSKKDLVAHIKELKERMKRNEQDFLIEFPWAGNLGQWDWDYKKDVVRFNDKKVRQLGYDPDKIGKVGFSFFTGKIHPDDYERVMENMRDHLSGKTDAYEVEYRIEHKDGHYIWYYDRGTVTMRDEDGTPRFIQGIVFDVTKSKKIEDQLIELSERDTLTKFYNRRMMYNSIGQYIEEHSKDGSVFSLIMFDIDHFKKINDTYGHVVGDETLSKLANAVLDHKRTSDSVYRYGGEEFFVLLPKTNLDGAKKVAQRLHQLIKETKIPKVGHITVSMGVVEYQKGDAVDDLVGRADKLMYEAKDSGRNTIKY